MNIARLVLGSFLLGSLLITPACGKKARPYLPKKPFTAGIVDLKGKRSGKDIVLEGKISGVSEPAKEKQIAGLRVYMAEYPLKDPPCSDCPIDYKNYEDLGSEVIKGKGFEYRLKETSKDRIYFFRIRIISS